MRGAVAVFLAELRARRPVLLATLAMSTLIPLVALAPGLEDQQPSDVREVVSLILLVVFGYGLALFFGAATFGADLSEGRLGFYFARPVSGLSIWAGRTTAVWCVIICAEVFALLPTLLANAGTLDLFRQLGWWLVPAFVVGPVFALLLAHAVSVMVRARTWWLLLDVIGATAAVVAAWTTLHPRIDQLSLEALYVAGGLLVAVLLIALLLAGTTGTVVGRADLRRTHGALSVVLWLVMAVGWTGVTAYVRWLDDFGPRDLESLDLEAVDPTGSWIGVSGRGVARLETRRNFIVSTTDERWIALRSLGRWAYWWPGEVRFAADGRSAAWLGHGRDDDHKILWRVDLGAATPVPVETTITTTSDADLELSADGRMAVLRERNGMLSVYDLLEGRLLAMARLPAADSDLECSFADEGTLRCFEVRARAAEKESRRFLIHELDLATREVRRVAEIGLAEGDSQPFFAAYSPSLLAVTSCPGVDCRLRLIDPGSGALLRETALPEWAEAAAFLADGMLVVRSRQTRDGILVAVQASETATWTEHRVAAELPTRIGGEVEPGRLAFFRTRRDERGEWLGDRVELLDLDTGEVRPIARGDDTVVGRWWGQHDFWHTATPMSWRPEAWRLFYRDDFRAIVRWDPEAGAFTTIAGRQRAPRGG